MTALGMALAFVLRLPALCWQVVSDDEAIYDAMAQLVRRGGCMYRDVLDHKPPGLVYLYAWTQNAVAGVFPHLDPMVGVHLLGAVSAAVTALGLALIGRQALSGRAQLWPGLLFAASSTAKVAFDGLAVNGELLMGLPTVFAVVCLLAARRRRGPVAGLLDLVAGVLVGAAGLVKWQAIVLGLIFPFLGAGGLRAAAGRIAVRGPLWLLGLGLPLGGAAAYFAARGALAQAWQWGVVYNLRYVAEGPDGSWALRRLAVQLLVVVAPAGLFYAMGLWGTLTAGARKQLRPVSRAALRLWAAASALAVCLGGRFFGHYFLQLELPLCLLGAPAAAALWARRPRAVALGLCAPAVFFAAFSCMPTTMRNLLNGSDPAWPQVGAQLAAASKPHETLFVWGNAPLLYHYAGRTMGTRFAFCNYLTGLSPATRSEYLADERPNAGVTLAWEDLFDDLQARRPDYILDTADAGWKGYAKFPLAGYPALQRYVQGHYRPVRRVAGATLYARNDVPAEVQEPQGSYRTARTPANGATTGR